MSSWTNEGGILKQKIQQGKDYEVVPELLWSALHSWYGGDLQIPRPVSYENFCNTFLGFPYKCLENT